MKLWCVLFLFLHFYQLNNNKGVYPTPYTFSLETFCGFLQCYIFLCKVADYAAEEIQKVFDKWETPRGRKKYEKIATKASNSKKPWQSTNITASSATSHKFIRFGGDTPWEGIEPWANVEAIDSEQMAKDIQDWTQGLSQQVIAMYFSSNPHPRPNHSASRHCVKPAPSSLPRRTYCRPCSPSRARIRYGAVLATRGRPHTPQVALPVAKAHCSPWTVPRSALARTSAGAYGFPRVTAASMVSSRAWGVCHTQDP